MMQFAATADFQPGGMNPGRARAMNAELNPL